MLNFERRIEKERRGVFPFQRDINFEVVEGERGKDRHLDAREILHEDLQPTNLDEPLPFSHLPKSVLAGSADDLQRKGKN